jgi:hypothetical protein
VTSTTRDGTVTGRRIVGLLDVLLVGVGAVAGVLVSVFVTPSSLRVAVAGLERPRTE